MTADGRLLVNFLISGRVFGKTWLSARYAPAGGWEPGELRTCLARAGAHATYPRSGRNLKVVIA